MQIPETEIIVSKDGTELLRKTVRPGDYVVGRDEGCEVQVEVERVAPRHAQLTVNFDHALIEDLGSDSGTLVNGQPIKEPTRLWPNQKIQVGAATIELRRIRTVSSPDVSLAPQTAAVQKLLPEQFLRDKKYEIGKVVAQGGMGAILDAKEATIERRVAMKVMLDGSSPDDLTRFVAEAKITGQLEHPSIVPVYELSVDENGQVFYTMKMVRGITLRKVLELLAEGDAETVKKYPLPALLTIFQKVCDALAFAHAKGVIHRDLKPENIMLDDFGVVLVMDWGLAKVIGQKPAPAEDVSRSLVRTLPPEASGATLAGTVMGTPQYMSPEQARGEVEDLDVRSDIYALGAILYHVLALRPSVSGGDAWEIVRKVAAGHVEPLAKPGREAAPRVPHHPAAGTATTNQGTRGAASLPHLPGGRIPDSLAAVVRKAMSFDRGERYPHVADLQRDIEAYQNGRATRAENASLGKQLVLLVKRHKALFSTAAAAWLIITALAVWFIINVTRAKQQAENERNVAEAERARATANEQRAVKSEKSAVDALQELRGTAPTFFEQARLLTEHEQLSEALEKIDIALKLTPGEAGYYLQRGNILQSMERFTEAAEAYAAALRLKPGDENARANLDLSRTLAAAKEKDGTLSLNTRMKWRDTLSQQGRAAEAILAGRGTATDAAKMMPAWQAKLDAWLGKNAPRLRLGTDGFYALDLVSLSLTDLSPLRGMPVSYLNVTGNPHLKDLSPLADCPLAVFTANQIPDLMDLSPLKGKKLNQIQITHTAVRDLRPLAGMPLNSAFIGNTPVSDLTPLRDLRLKVLTIDATAVRSLEPLRGQPLDSLNALNSQIASLDPVGDAPLTMLRIDKCGRLDLAALRTRRLRELYASDTTLEHLEVLAEFAELEVITLPKNLTDPTILRKLPHLRKIDAIGSNGGEEKLKDVAEFWKEYDAQHPAAPK